MTEREEQAIIVLNTLYNNPLLSDIHRQALEVGIMAIKNPNNWISVSERLPEGLLVKTLVSCEDSLGLPIVPKVALYDGYEHSWVCDEKVIAWMPLPPCYEPQKSEDKE